MTRSTFFSRLAASTFSGPRTDSSNSAESRDHPGNFTDSEESSRVPLSTRAISIFFTCSTANPTFSQEQPSRPTTPAEAPLVAHTPGTVNNRRAPKKPVRHPRLSWFSRNTSPKIVVPAEIAGKQHRGPIFSLRTRGWRSVKWGKGR